MNRTQTRKLRVAFLVYDLPNRITGIGNYARNVSRELRKLGVQVDVFSPRFVKPIIGPVLGYFRNLSRNLREYDVVHSNEAVGVLVPHHCIVESFHHQYLRTGQLRYMFFSEIECVACKRALKIITPSENSARELQTWGEFSGKITVIPHGVDDKIFRKDEKLRETYRQRFRILGFTVISVGRLEKHKRQADIIRALDKIPESTLILVGGGKESKFILREAKRRDVRLLHFDHVPTDDLVGLYNSADVYVHASVLEGFGLTTLEAMTCGLPVVAYETADFAKMIGDGGILLERRNPSAIADGINCLAEDPTLRKSMAWKALAQSRKFTWEKSASKHLEAYSDAIRQC